MGSSAANSNALQFAVDALGTPSTLMTLTTSGNLGIGTSSPTAKLHVKDATGTAVTLLNLESAYSNPSGNKSILWTDATSALGRISVSYTASTGSTMSFGSLYNGGYQTSDLMVLDSSGNLGIGTSSPFARLQVVDSSANYTSPQLMVGEASNATGKQLHVGYNTTANTGYIQAVHNGTGYKDLLLNPNGGNLGLGVTPPAWESGTQSINIGAGTALWNPGSGTATRLLTNAYRPASGNYTYRNNGGAGMYEQNGAEHRFFTAATGTAGNAITFTQAMTLDASGNLGIGTTSPAKKLHVAGNAIGGSVSARIENTDATSAATFAQLELITGLNTAGISAVSGSGGDGYLAFTNENTERARITSGGDFGIGSASPQARLYVEKNVADVVSWFNNSHASTPYGVYVKFSAASPNNTSEYFFRAEDSTAQRATIRSNGGLANYQANNVDLSDARTKKEINPASSMWDKIGALEIVTYKYNDQTHDDVNVGVIAQQVESVEPVWVDADGFGNTPEGEEPLKTVYTKDITFAAIKALQESMARIEKLEAEVSALKGA